MYTGFESRPGRMCVIEIVHTVLQTVERPGVCSVATVLCTIKNPQSHSIRVEYSPDFGIPSVEILP